MSSWLSSGLDKISNLIGLNQNANESDIEIAHKVEQAQKDILRKLKYNDVDFFHLNGYECWAKCLKQYDGDTITVAMFLQHLANKPFKFRIRLADIDTAEKDSNDPAEVAHAMKASNRLKQLMGCPGDLIYIKCHRYDKYNRVLAHIYQSPEDTFSFNEILRVEGLAYSYKGGTRRPFREWIKEQENHLQTMANAIPAPVGGSKLADDNIQDAEVLDTNPEKPDYEKTTEEIYETSNDFNSATNVPTIAAEAAAENDSDVAFI